MLTHANAHRSRCRNLRPTAVAPSSRSFCEAQVTLAGERGWPVGARGTLDRNPGMPLSRSRTAVRAALWSGAAAPRCTCCMQRRRLDSVCEWRAAQQRCRVATARRALASATRISSEHRANVATTVRTGKPCRGAGDWPRRTSSLSRPSEKPRATRLGTPPALLRSCSGVLVSARCRVRIQRLSSDGARLTRRSRGADDGRCLAQATIQCAGLKSPTAAHGTSPCRRSGAIGFGHELVVVAGGHRRGPFLLAAWRSASSPRPVCTCWSFPACAAARGLRLRGEQDWTSACPCRRSGAWRMGAGHERARLCAASGRGTGGCDHRLLERVRPAAKVAAAVAPAAISPSAVELPT